MFIGQQITSAYYSLRKISCFIICNLLLLFYFISVICVLMSKNVFRVLQKHCWRFAKLDFAEIVIYSTNWFRLFGSEFSVLAIQNN